MIRAALFGMGSTLLEIENHPWEELTCQGIGAVYDALNIDGAVLPGREAFCQAFREAYRTTWQEAEQSSAEVEIRMLLESTARELRLPCPDADVLALARIHYRPVSSQVTLYADTIDTLVEVRSRGLKIGLVSNTVWPGALHREDLERSGTPRLP